MLRNRQYGHHPDDPPLPFEDALDDFIHQQAVPLITGKEDSRIGMAGDDGAPVQVKDCLADSISM